MTWWNRQKYKDFDGIMCDGSIRSGKTLSMTVGFVLWATSTFNNQSFALCGRTIESLRRNVVSHIPEWVEGYVTVVEKRNENKLIISDGEHTNTFYMFGGRDEKSYTVVQGVTLAGALLDEVALMPRSFVEQVLARCSVTGSKFWFNCNPEGPTHWFYVEWIKKPENHNMLYLHFTMADNYALDPKVRERYESLYEGVFYSRYILGLWVRAEGLVYPMFDEEKHIIKFNGRVSPRHRYYVSIDYGTVNPFACGLWEYNPGEQKAHMIRELYYNGGSAKRVDDEAYYKMLKKLIGDVPIEYIVIDPSAASFIATVQKYGEYIVVKANNDVLNGIQTVTKYLTAGVLGFDESCEETFKEFKAYRWDEESTEDRVIKETDHSMDQIRYFCYTVLKNELLFIL